MGEGERERGGRGREREGGRERGKKGERGREREGEREREREEGRKREGERDISRTRKNSLEYYLLTVTVANEEDVLLSCMYRLPVASITTTEQLYSPLSSASTLATSSTSSGISLLPLMVLSCLLSGVVHMNCIIVLVSTEGERGEKEQERERGDPESGSSSGGYTATSGLGTEGIIVQVSNQYTFIAYS